jgi:hypothetical protein
MIASHFRAIPVGTALIIQGLARAIYLALALLLGPASLVHVVAGTPTAWVRLIVYVPLAVAVGIATSMQWSIAAAPVALLIGALGIIDSIAWCLLDAHSAPSLNPFGVDMAAADMELLCAVILIAGLRAYVRAGSRGSMPQPDVRDRR